MCFSNLPAWLVLCSSIVQNQAFLSIPRPSVTDSCRHRSLYFQESRQRFLSPSSYHRPFWSLSRSLTVLNNEIKMRPPPPVIMENSQWFHSLLVLPCLRCPLSSYDLLDISKIHCSEKPGHFAPETVSMPNCMASVQVACSA